MRNPTKDCVTPQCIDLKLKINGDTEEIFNIESALAKVDTDDPYEMLEPLFDIKLHFEDEVTTDDKDEQESLLIIGRGTYMKFDSKSGIAQQIFIMN